MGEHILDDISQGKEQRSSVEFANEEIGGWVEHFVGRDSPYRGYTSSMEKLDELIQDFEMETHSHFSIRCSRFSFGKELDLANMKSRSLQIHWMDTQKRTCVKLENDGVPFVIMGNRTMECMYGPDSRPRKCQAQQILNPTPSKSAQKHRCSSSKKVGCLAKIHLRHIVKFPKYKNTGDQDHYIREKLSTKLRQDLSEGGVTMEHQFHLQLPLHHTNHNTASPSNQPLDRRLVKYLRQRSKDDTFTVREMQIILEEYLRHNLFSGKPLPPKTNTRFWPTRKTVKNNLHLAYNKGKESTCTKEDKSAAANIPTPS